MTKPLSHLTFTTILLFATGCAHKNPDFLRFDQEKKEPQTQALALPMVKNLCITKKKICNAISWEALKPENITTPKTQLCGYNLYRFTKDSFIPYEPLNKAPLQNCVYLDMVSKKNRTKKYYYLVKGVFKHNEIIIEGPSSAIRTT